MSPRRANTAVSALSSAPLTFMISTALACFYLRESNGFQMALCEVGDHNRSRSLRYCPAVASGAADTESSGVALIKTQKYSLLKILLIQINISDSEGSHLIRQWTTVKPLLKVYHCWTRNRLPLKLMALSLKDSDCFNWLQNIVLNINPIFLYFWCDIMVMN